MSIILHIPVVLSFILLAAHFLRDAQTVLVLCALVLPFLLLTRKIWAVRLVQFALVLGALEWIRSLLALQAIRVENGMPWTRLAIIIGCVALFTGCSALVFFHTSLKQKYMLHKD